jgi:hypothetical protein
MRRRGPTLARAYIKNPARRAGWAACEHRARLAGTDGAAAPVLPKTSPQVSAHVTAATSNFPPFQRICIVPGAAASWTPSVSGRCSVAWAKRPICREFSELLTDSTRESCESLRNQEGLGNHQKRPFCRYLSPLPDSNRGPPPYHGGALPTELRGRAASVDAAVSALRRAKAVSHDGGSSLPGAVHLARPNPGPPAKLMIRGAMLR